MTVVESIEAATARIDIAHARRIASLMIDTVAPGAEKSAAQILVEAEKLDPAGMLQRHQQRRACWKAHPLDPEGKYFRLFPGEFTVISGHTGTGKTTMIRQMICSLLKSGSRVFAASLEEDPEDFVIATACVAAGVREITENLLKWFLDAYGARFRVWNVQDETAHREILATIRQLSSKGFKHFFIDSLMCLDIDVDDYNGQKEFTKLLKVTASVTQGHIYLVAHPKKPVKSDERPRPTDVSGAASIGNLAYNVLFTQRADTDEMTISVHPMKLLILKQRTLGKVGQLHGWYHEGKQQVLLTEDARPVRYLPDAAYADENFQEEIPAHIANPNAWRVGV